MASIERLMQLEPTRKIEVKSKKKDTDSVFYPLIDLADKLREAFSKTEMSELINIQGDRKGHYALLGKAVSNFEAMTTYEYRVHLTDGTTRRAYTNELEEPHEHLYAKSRLHASKDLYKKYARVLWIATGYVGYAEQAGYTIKYTRSGRRVKSTVLDVVFEHENELLAAMAWWESPERRKDIVQVLKKASAYENSITYRASKTQSIVPYIDWKTAASAVVGMRIASGESAKNSKKMKYGKEIRPDEKAQYIREYIEAESVAEGTTDSQSIRDAKELCRKVESYVKEYEIFNIDKTNDILTTLRRSNYGRITQRQQEYLTYLLKDMEDYKEVKETHKVGEDLFDLDDFFESLAQ